MSNEVETKESGNRAFGKNNAKTVKDDYFGQANAVHSMTAGANDVVMSFDLRNALKFQHALEIGANQLNRYNKAAGEQRVIELCFFLNEENKSTATHVTATEYKKTDLMFKKREKSLNLFLDYNDVLLTLHRLRQSITPMTPESSLDVILNVYNEIPTLNFNYHQIDPHFTGQT
ncbi:hypothetical protein RMSM_01534 [Rhodopirellula maiorica SM1]|uniref:Uncharacterized protein n=1 Tax=Rhodopirellula maiorica SM1 TaxID=1265738 RepID=M5S5Q8_9BACT|nr:hypothetical protein [Rhodopirellula maiorica]EMI21534.1 hypothetical protein RMSM_01534 [Rhodopirellula maiorica SM1]